MRAIIRLNHMKFRFSSNISSFFHSLNGDRKLPFFYRLDKTNISPFEILLTSSNSRNISQFSIFHMSLRRGNSFVGLSN